MKKLCLFLVALILVFAQTACFGQPSPAPSPVQPAATVSPSSTASSNAQPSSSLPASSQSQPTTQNKKIRLSTTTSVNDSGLLPSLQKEFESDTGFVLEVTSAGTGAAIEKGRTGDADCLLVHAKASEEAFIGEGYGEERVPFMYNFFVIVGPPADPAGVAACKTAAEAFQAIAALKKEFISRGDDSGTHKAELNVWKAAGIDPKGNDWYVSTGQGMGTSLNIASEKGAYIMTDKATYLAHGMRDTMKILMEKSDEMKNTYAMIAVSKKRFDDINAEGADALIRWMTSPKALGMIGAYGVAEYKEQLFFTEQ